MAVFLPPLYLETAVCTLQEAWATHIYQVSRAVMLAQPSDNKSCVVSHSVPHYLFFHVVVCIRARHRLSISLVTRLQPRRVALPVVAWWLGDHMPG
jgi:hypothetical protein